MFVLFNKLIVINLQSTALNFEKQKMIKFTAIVFLLAELLHTGIAEKECKESELRDCLGDLQHSVIEHFRDLGKVDKDKYCLDVDKGKRCMDNALENCHDKHSHMAYLISSFYVYLNQICSEKGKIYMDIAPCLKNHASQFESCETDDKKHPNPMEEICRETDYLKCVASLSKKICDRGQLFGSAVEQHVSNLHSNVCYNSAGVFGVNFYALILTILCLFLTMQKV